MTVSIFPTLSPEVSFHTPPGSTPSWDSVSSYLQSLSSRRGRQMELDVVETGEMIWGLDNRNRDFDPEYQLGNFFPLDPIRAARLGVGRNDLTNPSFEVDTDEWTLWITGLDIIDAAGLSRVDFDRWALHKRGSIASAEIVRTAGAGATGMKLFGGGLVPASPGMTLGFRAAAKPVNPFCQAIFLKVRWWNSAPSLLSENQIGESLMDPTEDVWYALEGERTAPNNTAWAEIAVEFVWYSGFNMRARVDACQITPLGLQPYLSQSHQVFFGDVIDWPQEWGTRTNYSQIQILDAFDALQAEFVSTRIAELSGARINAILDAISWPAGKRAIDTGQSLMVAKTYDHDQKALDSIQDVARSENGIFFVSETGVATFHERHRQWKAPYNEVVAYFTNSSSPFAYELPFTKARVSYRTRENLRNNIEVTSETGGGTEVRVTDTTSRDNYRLRSHSVNTILSDANECQTMAEYLLGRYKDPMNRVEEIVIEPNLDPRLWEIVMLLKFGDRVQVRVIPPGPSGYEISSIVTIEHVSHVMDEGRRWVSTFKVSPSDLRNNWILGESELGVSTRLGY